MRRNVVFLAVFIVCVIIGFNIASAHGKPASKSCRFGPEWTTKAVKKTIWCAERRFPVEGGVRTALCIAERESGFYARAANPYSSALGIYQVVDGTWDSWYWDMPNFRRWFQVGYDRTNARSNILVSIRKMSHEGLAPWGYSC